MVKLSIIWKSMLLPLFYYLSNLTYNSVFNMFGIDMVVRDRVESFLLICAVALTALMVWGAVRVALNESRARPSY